ncbi:MAG: response regulator [Gammaproteobacteria bacterium]|nr:response regulator [Gammaproteobacteria bacterium]
MIADNKQVLIVDDESISQMLLEYLFKSLGYGVTLAKNGEEALMLFEREFFPYIVMDFNMPKMNGLSAVKAIREIEKMKNQQPAFILGLTAEEAFEQQQAGLSVGMNVVHTKPVSLNVLKDVLKAAISC